MVLVYYKEKVEKSPKRYVLVASDNGVILSTTLDKNRAKRFSIKEYARVVKYYEVDQYARNGIKRDIEVGKEE